MPDAGMEPLPDGGVAPRCEATSFSTTGRWDTRFTVPGFAGHDGIGPSVQDFARSGDGGLYAAGYFAWLGEARANGLARQLADGGWEGVSFPRAVPRGGFSSLAFDGARAAFATNAGAFSGPSREVWLDDGSGPRVIGTFDGPIRRLAWFQGQLWAVGSFETPVRRVAVWNGSSWQSAPQGGITGEAYELWVDGDELYVGGTFTALGGVSAKNLARWNGTAWLGHSVPLAVVYAVTKDAQGALLAGGFRFMEPGAGGVVRFDGLMWSPLAKGLSYAPASDVTGVVTSLARLGDDVYATGCFDTLNGPPGAAGAVKAKGFARWRSGQWERLDETPVDALPQSPWLDFLVCGFDGQLAVYDVAYQRLFAHQGRLYAGGTFAGAGSVPSQSLLAYDGTAWSPQGAGAGLGLNGELEDVAVGGAECTLHGVGRFTHVAGQPLRDGVLQWSGSAWRRLGGAPPAGHACTEMAVTPAGGVTVGCEAGGRYALYAVSDAGWVKRAELDVGFRAVHLEADGSGRVWLVGSAPSGGAGAAPDGAPRGFLAKLEGGALSVVEAGFDGLVSQAAAGEGRVVVVGAFSSVAGVAARGVAVLDSTGWHPLGDGVPGRGTAVEVRGTQTWVASMENDAAAVWRFDGAQRVALSAMGSGFPTTSSVESLSLAGEVVVVAGSIGVPLSTGFIEVDRRNVWALENGQWRDLAGGVGATRVRRVVFSGGALWFAGGIAEAGSTAGGVSSVGVARYLWE